MELLPASRPFSPVSHFNEWLYETIQPWLKGSVLEVNSGPESLSSTFMQRERKVHLNSTDSQMRQYLRAKYKGIDTMRSVNPLDFQRLDFEDAYSEEYRVFDTVLILNNARSGHLNQVVVHHAKHVLRDRGRLIVLVPVRTALFNGVDDNQEECKKYNRKDIRRIISDDMEMLMTEYFIIQPNSIYQQSGLSVLAIARKIT